MIGRLEESVLLVLRSAKGEATATDVFEALSGRKKKVSSGAIYVTLDRLERKNLVARRKGDPSPVRGGKACFFYRITDEGRAALIELEEEEGSIVRNFVTLPIEQD